MSDGLGRTQEVEGDDEQRRVSSLKALYAQAETVKREVKEIEDHLLRDYAAEPLFDLSRRFETISKNFTNYVMVKSNVFYEIVHRSGARRSTVNDVANEARKIAQLFEKYGKSPKSYSRTNCSTQINRLVAELENLKDASTPGSLLL
jgi:hypothetical protein